MSSVNGQQMQSYNGPIVYNNYVYNNTTSSSSTFVQPLFHPGCQQDNFNFNYNYNYGNSYFSPQMIQINNKPLPFQSSSPSIPSNPSTSSTFSSSFLDDRRNSINPYLNTSITNSPQLFHNYSNANSSDIHFNHSSGYGSSDISSFSSPTFNYQQQSQQSQHVQSQVNSFIFHSFYFYIIYFFHFKISTNRREKCQQSLMIHLD